MTPIADIALAEFTRRRAILREAIASGKCTQAEAEARLAPWGAVALAAGVPLDRVTIEAPEWLVLPSDLAPREVWHAELARARDAAVGKAGCAETIARALGLCRLSAALGVFTPFVPAHPEEPRQRRLEGDEGLQQKAAA